MYKKLLFLSCNFSSENIQKVQNINNRIIINKKNEKCFIVFSILGFVFLVKFTILLIIFGEKKYAEYKFKNIKREDYIEKIENLSLGKSIQDDLTDLNKLEKELRDFQIHNQNVYNNIRDKILKKDKNPQMNISNCEIYKCYLLNNQKEIFENKINFKLYEIYKQIFINTSKWYHFGYYEFINKLDAEINNFKYRLCDLYIYKEFLEKKISSLNWISTKIEKLDITKDIGVINEIKDMKNQILKEDLENKIKEIKKLQELQLEKKDENLLNVQINCLQYYIYLKMIEDNSSILNLRCSSWNSTIDELKNELENKLENQKKLIIDEKELKEKKINRLKEILYKIEELDITKDVEVINQIKDIQNEKLKEDLENKIKEIEKLKELQLKKEDESLLNIKINCLKYYICLKIIENNSFISKYRSYSWDYTSDELKKQLENKYNFFKQQLNS